MISLPRTVREPRIARQRTRHVEYDIFPFSAMTLLVGRQQQHPTSAIPPPQMFCYILTYLLTYFGGTDRTRNIIQRKPKLGVTR